VPPSPETHDIRAGIGPGKNFEFKDLSLEHKGAVLLGMKEGNDKVDKFLARGMKQIDRYLINSPMLQGMKNNADGSLTLYIQKDSPCQDGESNWLPAPNETIYLVMRLY
jgi:Protein of unknown function (DUF1214)